MNLEIFEIQDMQPLEEKSVSSSSEAKWALETNQGWFKRNNISVGDKVNLNQTQGNPIKIKIIKLSPEAHALSKKIQDALTIMIGQMIDTVITPGKSANEFNIDILKKKGKEKK